MSLNTSSVSTKGIGVMTWTWRDVPYPEEQVFGALLEAIKINLPAKTFVNGGEFYGLDSINLKYLQDFFKKYPEQRQHTVISIKGAFSMEKLCPTTDRKSILDSIDRVLKYIPDLDIFEPARLNPEISVEETVAALDEAVDTKKIKAYTFSETSATTLAKIYKLAKHKPVGVEIEFSVFTRDIIENGLAAVTGELDVPIIAYSPLSRGLLTGDIKTISDVPEGDHRLTFHRFHKENIEKNFKVVEFLNVIAAEKKVTTAQVAIAWVAYHNGKTINGIKFPKIILIPSSSSAARAQENNADVQLTETEFKRINDFISGQKIHGLRYNEQMEKYLYV